MSVIKIQPDQETTLPFIMPKGMKPLVVAVLTLITVTYLVTSPQLPESQFEAFQNSKSDFCQSSDAENICLEAVLKVISEVCASGFFVKHSELFPPKLLYCAANSAVPPETAAACECDCEAGHDADGGTACYTRADGRTIPCNCTYNSDRKPKCSPNEVAVDGGCLKELCKPLLGDAIAFICSFKGTVDFDGITGISCGLNACGLCALDCACIHGSTKRPYGECMDDPVTGYKVCKCLV